MYLPDWKLAGSHGYAAGGRLASSAAAHLCRDRDIQRQPGVPASRDSKCPPTRKHLRRGGRKVRTHKKLTQPVKTSSEHLHPIAAFSNKILLLDQLCKLLKDFYLLMQICIKLLQIQTYLNFAFTSGVSKPLRTSLTFF